MKYILITILLLLTGCNLFGRMRSHDSHGRDYNYALDVVVGLVIGLGIITLFVTASVIIAAIAKCIFLML